MKDKHRHIANIYAYTYISVIYIHIIGATALRKLALFGLTMMTFDIT